MQGRLNADRQAYGFTRLTVLSNAPPILAFTTVALGGFRGLISNALWMRASELQEEERYWEMVQLSDWITTLEPHFTEVWTMQAWNMAYNISVKCKDFEDRWRWVKRGLDLCHQGLKWNPGEVNLYKELSWIFRHKIGQGLDDAHMVYKIRWAQLMQDVLGGHPDFACLLNPQTPADRERVRKLREDYQMDPAFIREIDNKFGPLDWRLPDAHAIYWAELGVRNGTQADKDLIRRFSYSLMQQSCKRGGALPPWVTNVTAENFILWPNLDLVSNANESFEWVVQQMPDKTALVQTAQKNFLKDAVVLLYEYNRTKEALHWFNYLKQNFTNAFQGGETNMNVEEYAFAQIQADVLELDPNKAASLILGMITQEYLARIGDDDDRAENFKRTGEMVWRAYMNHLPGPLDDPNAMRIALPPMEKLRDFQLEQMEGMLSPQNANYLRAKLGKGPRASASPPPNPSPPAGAGRP
jgi:hypothetical protein